MPPRNHFLSGILPRSSLQPYSENFIFSNTPNHKKEFIAQAFYFNLDLCNGDWILLQNTEHKLDGNFRHTQGSGKVFLVSLLPVLVPMNGQAACIFLSWSLGTPVYDIVWKSAWLLSSSQSSNLIHMSSFYLMNVPSSLMDARHPIQQGPQLLSWQF